MKARIKLFIGMAFAGAAVMAVSQSENLDARVKRSSQPGACYTQAEVVLLMKANDWSREDAETLLKLACQFSRRPK